jgi:DNA invertase Pin-like site-specific DNA recombinase
MGHLLGYDRVSTTDQSPQLQVDALELAGCYRVFTETASGVRADRPTLEQLLDQLRPGDTLLVWKLDRLGRSLRERTATGLAAAWARGRHGGRPSVMTAHKLKIAEEMYRSGQYTVAAIATTLGVSRASIYRHLDPTR